MNKVLIIFVGFGDFLMGCYLISIASIDQYYAEDYCKKKFTWLTSAECMALGAVNTVASQLSLFSMTALSVFRISSIGQMVPKSMGSVKSKLKVIGTLTALLLISLFMAIIPIAKRSENFFVNGLYYDENPLFTASVSKETHRQIFLEHYGRALETSAFTWKMIRKLVKNMFTDDYGGETSS